MKKYIALNKPEQELIVKLLLCTVLATAISWVMGDVHNATIAVTANLFLYVDRGYRGSLVYATRRIVSQIIQGLLVLLLIIPCKYFALPVPDGIVIVVACCFAIAVGLPLNYKYTYAPLNCTLANATFIMACAVVQNMNSFPRRVLQCVIGTLIGYFVNYIVFPYQDRKKEILRLADESFTALIQKRDSSAFERSMLSLEKEFSFVIADKGKNRRTSRMTSDEILFLQGNKECLQKLSSFISVYEIYKKQITDECRNVMWEVLPNALILHKQMIMEGTLTEGAAQRVPIPQFKAECHEDLVLLSRLFEYANAINQNASVSGV